MEGLELIRRGIERLARELVQPVTDGELIDATVELHRLESLLVAQRASCVGMVDARQLWRADGSRALWAWLSRVCDMAPRSAKSSAFLARALSKAPLTREAFRVGDIDRDRALELARRAVSPRQAVAEAFAEAEPELVAHAESLSCEGLGRVLRYWETLVDQDGEEAQADDDHRSRHLHASEILRGMVRIDGSLDPVGGAIFTTELARLEQSLFDADWAAAKAEHGDDVRAGHLRRTPAQRRADALVEMARRSATHDACLHPDRQPRPLFSVHIGPDTVTRLCELASGTVIAPNLLVPHLGEADIERIVYGPRSRVIDLSVRAQFFTGGLRRAIELRDRWCAHPGCTRLAEHCQIDHITPRSQGGLTTQANGRPLCDTHNRWHWNHHQRHHSRTSTTDDPPPHPSKT